MLFILGLTPSSSSIEPLLKSMCEQIQMNYGPGESADSLPNEYNELCELFLKLLKVCVAFSRPRCSTRT